MLLADIYQKEERYEEAVASYENVYKKILEAEKKKFYLLSNEERLIKSEAALQLGKIYSDEKANITDKEKGKGYYWESIKILEYVSSTASRHSFTAFGLPGRFTINVRLRMTLAALLNIARGVICRL